MTQLDPAFLLFRHKTLHNFSFVQYTTPERFMAIWNSSAALKVAARRAKTTPTLATARASRFRREGMLLKKFKRGRKVKA